MPTYIRPARVDITEGGGRGGLVLIAAGVVAAAAVVAFVAAHIVLLAVCAGVFVAVMGGVAVWFRWAASPQRLRAHYHPRPTVRVLPGKPVPAALSPAGPGHRGAAHHTSAATPARHLRRQVTGLVGARG